MEPTSDRGRSADHPFQIPKAGWKDICKRTWREVKDDRVTLIGAAVAFYAMLAVFPAIIAMVSLYGLFADPADLERHLSAVSTTLPASARDILFGQLHDVVSGSDDALSAGVVLSILGVLWSASAGVRAVIEALNIAYDEREARGFVKLRLVSLAFTLGAVLLVVLAVGALGVVPAVLHVGDATLGERVLQVLRWPVLFVVVAFALAVLYRYGPSREKPKWRWVSPGSLLATALWLLASAGFSWYASSFGKFNETYGALGGVIVLLTWFYLTAISIILGAEMDAEVERQTARDTTDEPDQPIGARGAYAADTLGPAPA
jgi:membrane protein